MAKVDFVGRKIGKLTVLQKHVEPCGQSRSYICGCDCGRRVRMTAVYLRSVVSASCGECGVKPPNESRKDSLNNALARSFITAPKVSNKPKTMADLAERHVRKAPAFKPYRVRNEGIWG